MEEAEEVGPQYRMCLFLFGNVDKRGQLEDEYAVDEELSSINHIDECHVNEVEANIEAVVSDITDGCSPVSHDTTENIVDSLQSIESKDYYDESELICLDAIENSVPGVVNSDDDYGELVQTLEVTTSVKTEEISALDDCSTSNAPFSSSLTSSVSHSTHPSSLPPVAFSVSRCRPEPSPPTAEQLSIDSSNLDSPSLAKREVDAATVMMPPPLHPAPVAVSRQQHRMVSPLGKTALSHDGDPHYSSDHQALPQRVLNTPLGNLLPSEYADVDITALFPHYSPNLIPRWGRIINLPYPPRKYDNLKHDPTDYSDEGFNGLTKGGGGNLDEVIDRFNLIFRNFLNLGEIPTHAKQFEEAAKLDELQELHQSPDPSQNYLAGAERSWWQIAFAERLARLENNSSTASTQAAPKETDSKKDRKSRKKPLATAANDASTNNNSTSLATVDVKAKSEEGESSSNIQSRYCTWRFGPAKYWYDQLEIPETADITKWTMWRKNVIPPVAVAPTQAGILNAADCRHPTLTVDSETRAVAADSAEAVTQAGPQISHSIGEVDEEDVVSGTEGVEDEEEMFLPFKLLQWEDDIIYDPQLSNNKVAASARQNAVYAGWIPSQVCRTMASFQDSYQGKYPGILGYKVLTGSGQIGQSAAGMSGSSVGSTVVSASSTSVTDAHNQAATALRSSACFTGPYSFFPVENPQIMDDSWRFDIIYDPQCHTPAVDTPFLLTLNKNDEQSLLDTLVNDDELMVVNAPSALKKKQPEHMQDGHINRASFHVTFGFASTRGTLTGALAKAEKGAEKVKRILGKHGFLAEGEWNEESAESDDNAEGGEDTNQEAANMASAAAAASGLPPKDPLNLSNDEFYAIRSGGLFGNLARCGPLQHSTPAVELWPPFFPTYNTPSRLRQFHRVPLKQYTRGMMSQFSTPISVNNLTRIIQRKSKEREEEKIAAGGGDIFFMRTPQDLSGFDGEVVLFEYSEEFPPLMNQSGMATRLVNYYRPLLPKDPSLSPDPAGNSSPPDLPYGSLVNVGNTDSPFLGVVRPGGCLQSMENNMFRAPIYPHRTPSTDFLVIRNRNGLWIRRVPNAFTVGQEVPLMEVPGPNSKRANNFARDFLQVYILRLFLKSTDEPKRIKMEEIRSAFPNHSESSVRKRLKICADFKRTGVDASWWVLRPDYRLPSEEEIRYLVQPEDFCAFFSMQAAELRLKDAGYGEKSLFVLDENPEEEEEKEGQPKMEDEVRAAPWNTTRAYLAAQRGGCFLELHGPADPTGCGEAFSYSKTSAKPGALFRQAGGEVARGLLKDKKTVTGTDADLRKLHLREARALLRSFGISEADLKTFKRWEIIDMVRFTSTERAKQGEEESTAKFARGNRLSMAEQIRCYREECQRIFDLQNRVLSNPELLSSDEEEEEPSSEEDEDDGKVGASGAGGGSGSGGASSNAIGGVRLSSLPSSNQQSVRNVHSLLTNRITSEELRERQEEAERENLKRSMELGKSLCSSKNKRKQNPQGAIPNASDAANAQQQQPGVVAAEVETTALVVYEASAASAGTILDLPAPFPNAQKKMIRITRTYCKGTDREYSRTEVVPWSPVVEIYLKIKQTRDLEQIHTFVGSDEQFKEQRRKEKRRIQDQLRRVRKQQELLRARGMADGGAPLRDSSGRLLPINRLPGSGPIPSSSRRRHKPSSNILKMRCGACGQTGHMRTNKECPMYGRNDAVAPPPPGGGRSGSRRVLPPGVEPETVAAAQELTSKPVAELLAATGGGVAIGGGGGGGDGSGGVGYDAGDTDSAAFGDAPRSIGASRLSDDSDDAFDRHRGDYECYDAHDEDSRTQFDSSRGRPNASLGRYLDPHQPPRRHDLKMTISKQLLDRLDAASEVVRYVEAANQRSRTSISGSGGRGGAGGGSRRRSTLASAADDDYPTSTIKHRGNRRRIDPRVAINHIFEGIYKGLSQIPGCKIFMHPVKEKDFPNYYKQIQHPMDLSQIRMKINQNAYSTREEFLSDIRLIHDNSEKFNGRFSSLTETAMKMCSFVAEEFCQKEMKLMRLEPLVNPLLDENDLVRLGFLLQKAVDAMRGVENSRAFHFPVEKRRYPDYYKAIVQPMDLSTLEKLIKDNRYHSREEFFNDADLIFSNCRQYNGDESVLTRIARKMLDVAHSTLDEMAETIETIEENIRQRLDDISTADSQSQHGGTASIDLTGPSTSKAIKRSLKQSCGPEISSKNPLYSVPEDGTDSTNGVKRRKVADDGENSSRGSLRSFSAQEDEEEGEFHYETETESRFFPTLQNADSENDDLQRPSTTPAVPNVYVDEDGRFLMDERSSIVAAQDTLVAQDLQLTSSESSGDLSEREGGELMDNSVVDTAAAALSRPPSRYSPDLASDHANDCFDSRSEDTPVVDVNDGSDSNAGDRPVKRQRVEFFIGSDEEDWDSGE
ncbi:transcription initiation factor TFIID subunit 1 [Echinococcus multilocularis]|uniref:Transcription initiation factor TFIID subunit 1 n=1 Tax=Echinococcus multilocularis TaxID=6211 RepID=A0A068YJR7_ECHMU|nr:transcription initiation factor TFIID subunit 1 [Echinococcus multilocularis]